MTIRELATWEGYISVKDGDSITLEYIDQDGEKTEVCKGAITKPMEITDATIFEFENEFGFNVGIGGILGQKGGE